MKHLKFIFNKRVAVFGLLISGFLYTSNTKAQDTTSVQQIDTVHIDEVVVSSKNLTRYQVGSKIEKISASQFKQMQDGNLEQLITRLTPITVKAMAGGYGIMRIRGTSPDHTGILFGSLNINSLTLGHSNVSNVPMYLFDELSIQYGSASVINGSGSMGGAINLGIENRWVTGVRGEARVALGSFGEQLYGTKLWLGNGHFESVTRAYLYATHNNFPFTNTAYRDYENGVYEIQDVQHNANVENKGIIQELNYRFKPEHTIRTKLWIERDWHLVQQTMQVNYYTPNLKETLLDNHVRIWCDYDNTQTKFKIHGGAGYVYDNEISNGAMAEHISTQRVKGEVAAEHNLWKGASIKAGIDYSIIKPDVYAYSDTLKNEQRSDSYLLLRQEFTKRLKATFNMRKGFVTDFNVPFTPALGLSFKAIKSTNTDLILNGNIAYSYNVPTFNDRYWEPGGNPDLLPEHGMNYELGLILHYANEENNGTLKLNAFYMDIEDWLLWQAGGSYWYAKNEDHVISKGIEFQGNFNWKWNNLRFEHGLNFTFNPAERINSDEIRQLEYVPLYQGTAFSGIRYKKWYINIDGRFSPWMYTTTSDDYILDGYFLLNMQMSYYWKLNDMHRFSLSGSLNNMLNVDYQTYYGYPMPRINYKISLTYNFK